MPTLRGPGDCCRESIEFETGRRIDPVVCFPHSLKPDPWHTHPILAGTMTMHHVRQEKLPFVGSSPQFVGAEQGDTSVSVFLFHGQPGSGPDPHRHPYDEIQFIREGRGMWTVNAETFEGGPGDIFVIKAGEIHSFKANALVEAIARVGQKSVGQRSWV